MSNDDYRSMFDREYLGHWDLPTNQDVIVTIREVVPKELVAPGGRKTKKPVVFFVGKEKGLALNKTNAKAVAGMYGPKVSGWIDKKLALYVTTTSFGAETVECIRVRPSVSRDTD